MNKEYNKENLNENEDAIKEPDDEAGVYVETHIKIFDPETNETFVSQRA